MNNLSLIDRPKTIATLEYLDIVICAIAAMLITLPLMFISVIFVSAHPLITMGFGVWLREKKKGKAFGYTQRWLYKKYYEILKGKRIFYVKTS